jgi:NAD(P)-dependent dehydrogenase (short-subunit alcohol dehydrogenase family)
MKTAIMLGSGSDIAKELSARLLADGWRVHGCGHNDPLPSLPWDLVVCCYGTLEPIGNFWEVDWNEWLVSWEINIFDVLRHLRSLYKCRRPGASVCFFSGAGANGPAPTYSAYAVSKIALTKMVECLDAESEDCKFFILGPGMMRTKIQKQTMRAGPRAANYERVKKFLDSGDPGTSPDDVYAFLMACVEAPKEAVGGRNFYVPLDDRKRLPELVGDLDALRLRRAWDEFLR